nr:helix-turn-helix transcriptional regulator [Pseudenhygromyxa sp. WMMC2535]
MEDTPLPEIFASFGAADLLLVRSPEPRGGGLSVGVSLAQARPISANERLIWTHVAAHLSASVHVLPGLARGLSERPTPKLGELPSDPLARLHEVLEQFVREHPCDDAGRLDLWTELFAGRWSIFEQRQGQGRRYYVVRRNPPDVVELRALTRREAQIANTLASGVDTKAAAAALGLDAVTIRGHLRAALIKLGLRSRTQLIALRAALQAG